MGHILTAFADIFRRIFLRAVFSSALLTTLVITTTIAVVASSQPARAADPANDPTILSFVRHYEARGDYDSYYEGIRTPPPKPLTHMTVGQVMAWQAGLKNVRSTAAGGYQIIQDTLAKLVTRHSINRNARYDAALQDRLGALLIADCASRNNTAVFANCLAGIWAALPRVSGANRGRSRYHGIAGNRALTTPENVLAMLEGRPFNLRTLAPRRANLAAFGSLPLEISVTGRAQTRNAASTPSRRDRIREAMRQASTGASTGGTTRTYTFDPYALE